MSAMSNVSASALAAKVVKLESERAEFIALLTEAEGLIRHSRCIEDDAMKCPGCSLESRIYEALKKEPA